MIFIKILKNKNPNKKREILIFVDDIIADIISNKKHNPIVTELFIRARKLNISLVFITQYYFAGPKIIRLHYTHYFIIKENFSKLQLIIDKIFNLRPL